MIIILIFMVLFACFCILKKFSIIIDIQYYLLAFKSNIINALTLCHREGWEGGRGGENRVCMAVRKKYLDLVFEVL